MARECPVCLEERAFDEDGALEGIGCARRHGVCIRCARELTYFAGCDCRDKTECSCSGFRYRCPLCRGQCILQPRHVLVLLKGSWDRARASAHEQSPEELAGDASFGRVVPVVAGC